MMKRLQVTMMSNRILLLHHEGDRTVRAPSWQKGYVMSNGYSTMHSLENHVFL